MTGICVTYPGEKKPELHQELVTIQDKVDAGCLNNGPLEADGQPKDGALETVGDPDADDEAADDTDDTSSMTSSASSTASSQSGGVGSNRKKSIPLSIRNLKRKHKKKRTKFSREFKPGDR